MSSEQEKLFFDDVPRKGCLVPDAPMIWKDGKLYQWHKSTLDDGGRYACWVLVPTASCSVSYADQAKAAPEPPLNPWRDIPSREAKVGDEYYDGACFLYRTIHDEGLLSMLRACNRAIPEGLPVPYPTRTRRPAEPVTVPRPEYNELIETLMTANWFWVYSSSHRLR